MGVLDTIRGWLAQTPEKDGDLRDAEADAIAEEYAERQADAEAEFLLGGTPGEFEHDQEPPR